ncbi:MAG: hypothetical protein H0V86_10705 [Chloroflexia bacterium]|nr:hypothetical protein [Chloroflexia bacterium]
MSTDDKDVTQQADDTEGHGFKFRRDEPTPIEEAQGEARGTIRSATDEDVSGHAMKLGQRRSDEDEDVSGHAMKLGQRRSDEDEDTGAKGEGARGTSI